MNKQFKPGQQAPEDGDYACYDSKKKCGGSCHLKKGQRFPATQHSGSYYIMENE